jgi:hypothetical protein
MSCWVECVWPVYLRQEVSMSGNAPMLFRERLERFSHRLEARSRECEERGFVFGYPPARLMKEIAPRAEKLRARVDVAARRTWSFLEFLRSNFWNFAALCALAVALGVRCHHVVATALFGTEMRSVPQNAPDDFRRSTSMRYASSPARAARWVAQSHGDAIGSASSVRRQPGGTAHSIREGRLCGSRWLITLP